MSEAERTIHVLIALAGVFALGYGSFAFVRGRFTVWTLGGRRSLDGAWGAVVALADVLLGVVAVLYGVVGLAAPESPFFLGLNSVLGLPERGEMTLELLNGEQIDLGAALFYLYWGALQAALSLSPLYLRRFQQA